MWTNAQAGITCAPTGAPASTMSVPLAVSVVAAGLVATAHRVSVRVVCRRRS